MLLQHGVIRLFVRFSLVVIVLLASLLRQHPSVVQADTLADIGYPFGPCQTWYVYQGYNGFTHYRATVPDPKTGKIFDNKYAFDLVKDSWGNLTGSGNTDIYAAASGTTTTWYGGLTHGWEVYIVLDDGRLISNSHLKDLPSTVGNGKRVVKGAFIGRVIDTKPGDVNHLHFHVAYNRVTLPLNFGVWNYPAPGPKQAGGPSLSSGEWRGTKIESSCQPSAPIPVGPANNATSSRRDISFQYRDSSSLSRNPHEFWVEVRNNATGGTIVSNWRRALDWTVTVPENGAYSWRVKARDGTTESAWSETRTVVVNEVVTCPKKAQGDTNCDGSITLMDFELWRREYVGSATTRNADFDNDGRVTLTDFERWRRGYNGPTSSTTNALTRSSTLGDQPSLVVFNQLALTARPSDTVELDVVLKNAGDAVSGANIAVQYSPDLLSYEEQPENYASNTCRAVNAQNNFPLSNRVVSESDATAGYLRIARLATGTQLPSGNVCLGTLVFRTQPNVPLPVHASVTLSTDTKAWEVAGSDVSVPYQFDPESSVANIEISNVNTPTNVQVSATTTDSMTLAWEAAEDNVTGYRLYEWTAQDSNNESGGAEDIDENKRLITEVSSTTFNYTLANIPCGTSSVYAVSAVRGQDESFPSSQLLYASQVCPARIFIPLVQS